LYSPPSIIRKIKSRRKKWVGHVARMGKKRNAHRVLVGSQKVRDHWEDRRRWVNNIKMDLREIEWDGVNWTDVA
jgi:hypothetical protein